MGITLLVILFVVLLVAVGVGGYRMMKGQDIYGRKK
jgi:hypothetical protein